MRQFKIVEDKFRKFPEINIELPKRGTVGSSGYDIKTPIDVILQPNEKTLIPTDICVHMPQNETLLLHIRSSIGIKRNVILSNVVGVIDSDFVNGETGGNIHIPVWNTSEEVVELKAGERVCQAIFQQYLITDDDDAIGERIGGIGSTGKH